MEQAQEKVSALSELDANLLRGLLRGQLGVPLLGMGACARAILQLFRLAASRVQWSTMLVALHHKLKLGLLRNFASFNPLLLYHKTRMYGYGSYYSTNRDYGYNNYASGGYEAASGPSSSQYPDHYGEYPGYASYTDDPQYPTQSYYYNEGYHEAGAPSLSQQYPNHDRQRPYEHSYTHSSRGDRQPPKAPKTMRGEQERSRTGKGREDEGDREVTPPPAPSPSPEYLVLASGPPSTISDSSLSRKLLVLDLNGTLVFRSPHASRPKYRPQDRGVPRLRPTFPRPYMRAFREYVFAPETKAWLDVMVWSSAQPHSVADMVDNCFGEHKRELVAVWARDTLGLSNDHYREHPLIILVHHSSPRPGAESHRPLFASVPCRCHSGW